MLFYPLYYDIISLTSLKVTQGFHFLLVLLKKYFNTQNSVWITEGLDNGDSNNRGPIVYI